MHIHCKYHPQIEKYIYITKKFSACFHVFLPFPASLIPRAFVTLFQWNEQRSKGFIYFIILWWIFYIANMLGEKEKPIASAHANDANKLIAWLIKTQKSSAFSLYFTNSTVQKLLKKMFECISK